VNEKIRVKNEDRQSLAMVAGPDGLVLRLPCGLSEDDTQVQAFIEAALDKVDLNGFNRPSHPMSRDETCDLVHEWAERIGVKVARVQIRPMSRKWASASSRGTLTLASDLLELPRGLVEYVICHDLVHLRVPDHGKGFRAMMNAHMPDSSQRERKLAAWALRQATPLGERFGREGDRS
jgi:hypothetical protein